MKQLSATLIGLLSSAAIAGTPITMHMVHEKGVGDSIGTIEVSATKYGIVLSPDLKGLTPGVHGFHLHENPSCQPGKKGDNVVPGLGAGGHFDPKNTGKHSTPWGDGHLGDLPALYVDTEGKATTAVLAPRLTLSDLKGRSLMIHAGGDTYAEPPKLGGGGARMACGVIK